MLILPLAPKTKPTSFLNILFRSADEFLACLKSKEAAREWPELGATRAANPRKS